MLFILMILIQPILNVFYVVIIAKRILQTVSTAYE